MLETITDEEFLILKRYREQQGLWGQIEKLRDEYWALDKKMKELQRDEKELLKRIEK